jgi:hypothetical protein
MSYRNGQSCSKGRRLLEAKSGRPSSCARGFLVTSVFLSGVAVTSGDDAADNTVQVVIETRILDLDPQAGLKSRHVIQINFAKKQIRDVFETGTTSFFGIELSSVRDKFSTSEINFTDKSVRFRASGETATGVRVVPNIDYNFVFTVKSDGTAKVSGCHDGYPAYSVTVEAKTLYEFKHKSVDLMKLFGSCDVSM